MKQVSLFFYGDTIMQSFSHTSKTILLCTLFILLMAAPAHATTLVKYELDQMVAGSESVIKGKVVEVRYEREGQNGRIYTFTTVLVNENYKGKSLRQITIRQLGGTIGETTMYIPGTSKFETGDEVVLFLVTDKRKKSNAGVYFIKGMTQGSYKITVDPKTNVKMVSRNFSGTTFYVQNASGVQAEMKKPKADLLTLSELETRIREEVAKQK